MPQAALDLGFNNDDTDNDPFRLYRANKARTAAPQDQLTQDLAGPGEHRQFVKETTMRDPLLGTLSAAASAAYSGAKYLAEAEDRSKRPSALGMAARALVDALGTGEAKTSKASADEIFAAGHGYIEGLRDMKAEDVLKSYLPGYGQTRQQYMAGVKAKRRK